MSRKSTHVFSLASFSFLMALTVSTVQGTVLVDEFDGPTLDTLKWTPSFAFGNSGLSQGGGVLTFTNRGRITAVPTFGDAKISGTVQINDPLDFFTTSFRNDGTFNPTFGAIANGITVGLRPLGNPDGPAVVINDLDAGVRLGDAEPNIQLGVPFTFMVKDLAGEISVFVDDMITPVLVVNSVNDSGDMIVFHNRERVTGNYDADFDRVEIRQIPEPQTAILMVLAMVACYKLRRR